MVVQVMNRWPPRLLLVGYGRVMSTDHLPCWRRRNARPVAVVDVSPARVEAARREGIARAYGSVADALDHEAVDVCDVASPPYAHAAAIDECVRRGVHVLCEKPVVTSPEDLRRLVAASARRKATIYPCHTWLYAPLLRRAMSLLDDGVLGTLRRIEAEIARAAPPQGVDAWMPHWRLESRYAGGGILMDHGYHCLYLAQHALKSRPAVCWALVGDHGQLEAADSKLSLRIAHRRRPCVWHSDDGLSDSPVHTKWFMGVLDGFADALAGDGAVSDAFVSSFYCMQAIWALYRSVAEGASQVVESA